MIKITLTVLKFVLLTYLMQNKLFGNMWNDFVRVVKTVATGIKNSMKKVLYIVAKGRGKPKKVEATPVATESHVAPSAAPTEVREQPIQDPMVVNTTDLQVEETESDVDADFVLRIETTGSSGDKADITLGAAYHLAVMEKLDAIANQVKKLTNDIERLEEKFVDMSDFLKDLKDEVANAKTVQESAIKLLKGLAAEIKTAAHDPEAIKAIAAELKSSTAALAAAVDDSDDVLPSKTVILHADDPTKPTVQVVLPEVLPEVIEAKAEVVVETVDPASSEPQVVVTVSEAAPEVVAAVEAAPAEVVADPVQNIEVPAAEPVATEVIETAPEQVDVTVTTDAAAAEEVKAESGVEVIAEVKKAVAEAEVPAVAATEEPAAAPAAPTEGQ